MSARSREFACEDRFTMSNARTLRRRAARRWAARARDTRSNAVFAARSPFAARFLLGEASFWRLLVPACVLLVASAAAGAFIGWRAHVAEVERLNELHATELAARIARTAERLVREPMLLARTIARAAESFGGDAAPAAAMEEQLFGSIALAAGVTTIQYGSARGELIGVERRADDATVAWLREAGGTFRGYLASAAGDRSRPLGTGERTFDPRTRDWYQSVGQAGRAGWSRVRHDTAHHAPVATFGVPVPARRGGIAGVVAVDVSLAALIAELRAAALGSGFVAFVMEGDGTLVAASSEEPVVARGQTAERRIPAVASTDGLVSISAAEVLRSVGSREATGLRFVRHRDLAGDPAYLATTPLGVVNGPDWLVVVATSGGAVAAGAWRGARDAAIIAVLGALSLGLVAGLFLRRRRHEIDAITRAINQMAPLDPAVDAGAPGWLPVEAGDGVGTLARSLHRLESRVRKQTDTLVEQRELLGEVERTLAEVGAEQTRSRLTHERAIERAETRARNLEVVVEQSGEAIVLADADGRIAFANRAFERLTGYAADELRGLSIAELRGEPGEGLTIEDALATVRQKGVFRGVLASRGKTGREFYADITMSPVESSSGTVTGMVAMMRDATDRVREEAEIHYLAKFDALTRLPNRVSLLEHLQAIARGGKRERDRATRAAVLYIDLDGFKPVNDRHGHHVGDRLLAEVANRLRLHLRSDDMVARVGGDEFVAVLSDVADLNAALGVANKIVESLDAPVVVGTVEPVQVAASVGVALYPDHGADAFYLIKLADAAMYLAKGQGGRRIAVCQPGSEPDVPPERLEHEELPRGRRAADDFPFPERLPALPGSRIARMLRGDEPGSESLGVGA